MGLPRSFGKWYRGQPRGNDSFFTPYTAIASANFQQRYRSEIFRSNVFYKSFNILIFIDLKIPYVHKIAMGHLISSLTLTPDT